MAKAIETHTSFEEVTEDPAKYGFPTFEEFVKMREHWLGKDEEAFTLVDAGSQIFKKGLKKFRFEINGYKCDNLPQVERIAREQGISLRDLDFQPEMIPLGGGQAEIIVRFVSKTEQELRKVMEDVKNLSEEERFALDKAIKA